MSSDLLEALKYFAIITQKFFFKIPLSLKFINGFKIDFKYPSIFHFDKYSFLVVTFLCKFCFRTWKTDLGKGACVIVETSVEYSESTVLAGGIRGIVLASRYLIEPCGSGRSRIMHLSRVDTK